MISVLQSFRVTDATPPLPTGGGATNERLKQLDEQRIRVEALWLRMAMSKDYSLRFNAAMIATMLRNALDGTK